MKNYTRMRGFITANKDAITLITVLSILGLSAYNLVDDKDEMHRHNDFFKEMREFKNKGSRNTSEMGLELCNRITILEFHLKDDAELPDCEAIYE